MSQIASQHLAPVPVPGLKPGLLLSTLFINVLGLALPMMLLQVYDRIVPNQALDTLLMLVIGVGSALILDAVLRHLRGIDAAWNAARYEHSASSRAFSRLLSTELGELERFGAGEHLERVNSVDTIRDFYAGDALLLLADLPFVLIFLFTIWYLAGPLVLVPIFLLIFFSLCAFYASRYLRHALEERSELDDRRYNFLLELFSGVHTVKGLAMESQMMRRYERLLDKSALSGYEVAWRSNIAANLGTSFTQTAMVATVGFGGWLVAMGQISIGGLAACTLLTGRTIQPLQRAMSLWARYQRAQLSRKRFDQIFELPAEEPPTQQLVDHFDGSIRLENVSFSYPGTDTRILSDLSLSVRPGESIGISGVNGIGKSTLSLLLAGLLKPSDGKVYHGDTEAHLSGLRGEAGGVVMAPQEAVLFDGTIIDNLSVFEQAHRENAAQVNHLLGVDEIISRLPRGYATPISDQAVKSLPAGSRQRLAISRALSIEPRVLLFDEANGGLDRQSDDRLLDFMESLRGRMTMIIITHRPSYLRITDRQFALVKGRLVPVKPRSQKQPQSVAEQTPAIEHGGEA